MYKKIISNYKILLDNNFDDKECSKLLFTTLSTIEICSQELLNLLD